ncbi:RING finger protein 37, variant 2 [Balamuthia mandrillaris]
MAWNFAREELGTTIACSTVTLDGHEAQKLLQQPSASSSSSVLPSFSQQQQPTHSSFICSHFVKPPVDLLLCFPEEISICSVVVGHRVHTHCMQVVALEVCAAGAEHTRQQQQEEWTFLGNYADLHRFKENGIRFFHPNRSQRYMNEQQRSSLAAIPFSRSLRALHRVKKLRLTIKKTYQGKAVACAFLQVWGELSHRSSSTSKTLLSRLHQLSSSEQTNTSSIELQHSISSATRNNNDTIHDGEEEEEKELSRRAVTIATHKIPPCYIDPITCELMLHPVVLPSGHHIDASTRILLSFFLYLSLSTVLSPSLPLSLAVFLRNSLCLF